MSEKGSPGMRKEERGVALVMVILVLLVLTVLGMTAVTMMTQEDRISSRQELQKAALYAAEAGLREGEKVLQNTTFSSQTLTDFITHTPAANTAAAPPSGGSSPQKPVPPPSTRPPQWDLAHLGTYLTTTPGGIQELANQEVTQTTAAGENFKRVRAYYSLYVRNNPDDLDPSRNLSPLMNYDTKLRLVAVGFVTDLDGVDASGNARVLSVKILEEELNWGGAPAGLDNQKCKDMGSTCSGFWSGRIG